MSVSPPSSGLTGVGSAVRSSAGSSEDGAPAFRGCTGLTFSLERRRNGDEEVSKPRLAGESNPGRLSVKTMSKVHKRADCQKSLHLVEMVLTRSEPSGPLRHVDLDDMWTYVV